MADQTFYEQIQRFNDLYKLPNNDTPTLLGSQRIRDFKDIMTEEVDEGEDLADKYEKLEALGKLDPQAKAELLTELADWLGDIVVYCASEARRWGIPLSEVLKVIMESNFSKLDANGMPIYDERGKVMKGPHYWKPEAKIEEILKPFIEQN